MSSNFDRWAVAFTSRRRFVQWIGTAAAVAPWAGTLTGSAVAQPPASPPAPAPAPGTPTPTPTPADAADADLVADARSLGEIVERRFGSRLSPAELAAVRDDMRDNLEAGRTLRKLALGNADEPAVTFRARPRED